MKRRVRTFQHVKRRGSVFEWALRIQKQNESSGRRKKKKGGKTQKKKNYGHIFESGYKIENMCKMM